MLNNKWDNILKDEFSAQYFKKLEEFINESYSKTTVYPKHEDIFNCLKITDYDNVKVVIIGQDPYHGENEAHGLSFSVQEGIRRPPSLNNIFKELYNDLEIKRENNNLTDWAKQGVLLLNSVMTVEKDKPLSHRGKGWETFTDNIIKKLNDRSVPIIFILWGNYARSKKKIITSGVHYIIESVHPSPLSANRGFFGSKPFSKVNKILVDNNFSKINW